MMRKACLNAIVAMGMLLTATQAQAGVVEWNDATFTVELQADGNALDDLYTFVLTADFTGFEEVDQEGHFDYLIGINFKPSQGDVLGVVGTPTTSDSVKGTWEYGIDNLSSSSSDCGLSSSKSDYFCGFVLDTKEWSLNPTTTDQIYSWTFTLRISGVTDPNALTEGAPVRALFADESRQGDYQTSLMSQTTAVPEPTSVSLLVLGCAVVTAAGKRRMRRS